MSSFAVKTERVVSVEPHPNADRLELIQVLDWRCVSQKGAFKPGDLCVYFPIDSILPANIETRIFGEDSKVKLTKSRVKTIKLRGAVSQGLAVSQGVLGIKDGLYGEGADLTEFLGVKKYDPPAAPQNMQIAGSKSKKPFHNPNFKKYTDLENAKNYPNIFAPDELVVVTEKIHGTNFRAGYAPTEANTLWKKIKKFFGRLPKYEFVYGSHNVQLQDRPKDHKTWLETHDRTASNVYAEAVESYRLRKLLLNGEVVYGEIYGDGIQKGFSYGCDPGERRLVLFDVMRNGEYLSPWDFERVADEIGVSRVPVLYSGPFNSPEFIRSLTAGRSVLAPSQKVREGVVVRPEFESRHSMIGRKILKFISDDYLLLKDNTDFH